LRSVRFPYATLFRSARLLAGELERAVAQRDPAPLAAYSERALRGVWRAQYFSYRMTTMLYTPPGATPFDVRRQEAELAPLTGSRAEEHTSELQSREN